MKTAVFRSRISLHTVLHCPFKRKKVQQQVLQRCVQGADDKLGQILGQVIK